MKNNTYPQETLTCPVCGKEFKPTGDTKYIVTGGYTCTWKCFLKEVEMREAAKESKKKNKNNQEGDKNK